MKYVRFIPTDDPNVIIGVREIKEEIHLDKLQKELEGIDARLKELRTVEVRDDYPDEIKDVIERVNTEAEEEKAYLIERRERLRSLLKDLKKMLGGKVEGWQ